MLHQAAKMLQNLEACFSNVTVSYPSVDSKGINELCPSPEQGSCVLSESARQAVTLCTGLCAEEEMPKQFHILGEYL